MWKASEKDNNYTNQGFIQGGCQEGETVDDSKHAAPGGVVKYAPSLKFGFSEVFSGGWLLRCSHFPCCMKPCQHGRQTDNMYHNTCCFSLSLSFIRVMAL